MGLCVETVRLGAGKAGAVRVFVSSGRRHTRFDCDWISDVCSSDLFVGSSLLHQLGESSAPRKYSTFFCAAELSPSWCSRYEPTNAIGTEPQTIQPTRRRFTVFLDRCTAAPMGRITTAATRSLEIAEDGFTPKSRMSIGVIRAPPPAPVSPTSSPTTALPRTMKGSRCIAGFLLP